MSGIAGIIRFDGGPVDPARVYAMTTAMAVRGPDGIAHWPGGIGNGGSAALGHCMLRTTPESLEETQPLTNEDESLVLVMDGRVDNWEDLRQRLLDKGARLRTRADAELVLRAYEIWGADCVKHIDGDFAFVIWDVKNRLAFCARDRVGMKPFVYRWDGRQLIFGSEIRAVLPAVAGPHHLNEGFLAETLTADFVSRDETLWQGVSRLPAARAMMVTAEGPRIGAYWDPVEIPLIRYKTDADYVEHYREGFFDAVRRQSRAIGPVGYDVSGGLDSSAIFSAADHLFRAGRIQADGIQGFTLKFEEGSDAYELDYARAVGTHLGCSIEEVSPVLKLLSWFLQDAARAATLTNAPNGIMHVGTFERCRQMGGRAYLDGVGGDQWLACGGTDLAESLQLADWAALRRSIGADITDFGGVHTVYRFARYGLFPNLPAGMRRLARRLLLPSGQRPGGEGGWLAPHLQRLYDARVEQAFQAGVARHKGLRVGLRQRVKHLDGADHAFIFEANNGMASDAGIENRSPFMDKAYIEMALGLPLSQLRSGKVSRHVHRQALDGVLPERVRTRTSKAEFSVVNAQCIKEIGGLHASATEPVWLAPEALGKEGRLFVEMDSGTQHRPFLKRLHFLCCLAVIQPRVL